MSTPFSTLSLASSNLVPGSIQINDYSQAAGHLFLLAQTRNPHAFLAAQVLLSFDYDEYDWAVYTPDLLKADPETFRCAIITLRGAYEFKKKPAELFQDGQQLMDQLRLGWESEIDQIEQRFFN